MRRIQEWEFEQFVLGSGSRLFRLAFLLTGDHGHAEDLVQAALERTARHWARLQGSPEAYTRKVIANLATDRWRRRMARPSEVYPQPPEPESAFASGSASGSGSGPGGECADPAGQVALRQSLIAALLQLPARQRAVLVLRFFADQTEAQTADALGISIGTVKSATSRGLARLRDRTDLIDGPLDGRPGGRTDGPLDSSEAQLELVPRWRA